MLYTVQQLKDWEECIRPDALKFPVKDLEGLPGSYDEFTTVWLTPHPILDKYGNEYPSVENFYQACKAANPERRKEFTKLDPYEAKKAGRAMLVRDDWKYIKYDVMREGIRQKFKDPGLRDLLISTGERQIIEWNWWRDITWGVNARTGYGCNALGKLLMERREILRNEFVKKAA